ncbi:MAG: hypothetical protein NHB32_15210 [Fischerella sp. CENA71]|nr:hypothetical protein [Fischerella sp. CENA71]
MEKQNALVVVPKSTGSKQAIVDSLRKTLEELFESAIQAEATHSTGYASRRTDRQEKILKISQLVLEAIALSSSI